MSQTITANSLIDAIMRILNKIIQLIFSALILCFLHCFASIQHLFVYNIYSISAAVRVLHQQLILSVEACLMLKFAGEEQLQRRND
jgi:hypothetical protein